MGHDLNDIFNIQMRGLNFNSLAAADGRMEARAGVLVAMVHCEVRGIISSGKKIHSDF